MSVSICTRSPRKKDAAQNCSKQAARPVAGQASPWWSKPCTAPPSGDSSTPMWPWKRSWRRVGRGGRGWVLSRACARRPRLCARTACVPPALSPFPFSTAVGAQAHAAHAPPPKPSPAPTRSTAWPCVVVVGVGGCYGGSAGQRVRREKSESERGEQRAPVAAARPQPSNLSLHFSLSSFALFLTRPRQCPRRPAHTHSTACSLSLSGVHSPTK